MSDEAKIPDDAPEFSKLSNLRLEFLKKTVAKDATNAEIGHFLELCAKYDLDPFAKEVWLAVSTSSNGKRNVLLMVGRAGLRKIATQQGMRIDGDVVHEADEFKVTRNADRTRTIHHEYPAKDRGKVLGAWAEVYDDGGQRGYFFALMSEYRPTSEAKLKWSPWGSQESTMILAAAERQALAMATPLGGLVAQGELDAGEERKQIGTGGGEPDGVPLPEAVEAVMARAVALGHAGIADRGAAEIAVADQPEEAVAEWVAKATVTLDAMEPAVDAEVVDA